MQELSVSMRPRSRFLSLVIVASLLHNGSAFLTPKTPVGPIGTSSSASSHSRTLLSAHHNTASSFDWEDTWDTLVASCLLPLASFTTTNAVVVPVTQTQVLNDVSHISLDLVTFVGQPGAIALRLAAVVGRLCTMAADYLPDQTMLPEELVFQAFMLTLAVTSLVRAAKVPYMASVLARSPTLRDGKTFRSLFAPAGVSWRQFKALTVSVLEWDHVVVGDTLDTENNSVMYWVYDGQVQVESTTTPTYTVERESKHRTSGGVALIGESLLLDHVVAPQTRKQNKKAPKDTNNNNTTTSPVLRVISPHATVLRINVPGLQKLMRNDPDLETAMRALVFQSMEAKLVQRNSSNNSTHWSTAPQLYHTQPAVQPVA